MPAHSIIYFSFMTILSQSFFKLVRRNFMTLPLFTTRHTRIFLLVIKLVYQ